MDTLNRRTHVQGIFVLLALIFFLGFSACDDTDDCASSSAIRNVIILKAMDFNNRGAKIADERSFDTLKIIGISDTILYTRKDTLQFFSLPINLDVDTTAYWIKRLNRVDTLVFSYTREQRYLSPTCGLEVLVGGLTVKYSTMIDSLSVVKNSLRKTDTYHVEIFE